MRTLKLLSVLLALAAAAPAAAQQADTATVLELAGPSGDTRRITAAEWARLPRATVQANDPGGPNHAPILGEYAGVPLRTLLTLAGVPEGTAVRGAVLRLYVVAEASDGYRVVFSVPELDPGFAGAPVVVADRLGGEPLDAHQGGPMRIVAPNEKRPARWVRGLTRISVHALP